MLFQLLGKQLVNLPQALEYSALVSRERELFILFATLIGVSEQAPLGY